MGIVLLTTLALSALLPSFTRFVGLEQKGDARQQYLEMMKIPNESYYVRQIEAAGLSKFHTWWTSVDEKFLKPIFGGESDTPLKSQRAAWEKIWSEEEESIIKGTRKDTSCVDSDEKDKKELPRAPDTDNEAEQEQEQEHVENEEEEKKSSENE